MSAESSVLVTFAQKHLSKREAARHIRHMGAPDLFQTSQTQTDAAGNTTLTPTNIPRSTPPALDERLYIRGHLLEEFFTALRKVLLDDRKTHLNATTKNLEHTLSLRKWTLLANKKQVPLHFQYNPKTKQRRSTSEQRHAFCAAYAAKHKEMQRLEELISETTPWEKQGNFDIGVLIARTLDEMKIHFDSDHPVWLAPEALEAIQHELLVHSRKLYHLRNNFPKHDRLMEQGDKYDCESVARTATLSLDSLL